MLLLGIERGSWPSLLARGRYIGAKGIATRSDRTLVVLPKTRDSVSRALTLGSRGLSNSPEVFLVPGIVDFVARRCGEGEGKRTSSPVAINKGIQVERMACEMRLLSLK